MKTIIRDGHGLVLRLVRRLTECGADRPQLILEEVVSRDWASATFVGQLHSIHLRLEGAAAAVRQAALRLQAELPEAEAEAGDWFLAAAEVIESAIGTAGDGAVARLTIEALTLEA